MRRLAILVVPLALGACAIHVHQRDPLTLEAIDATIKNRRADVGRAVRALEAGATMTARPEDGARLAQEARNLRALDAAEEVRLSSWSWRESQKSDEAPR